MHNIFRNLNIRKIFSVAVFYATEFGEGCVKGYGLIKDKATCNKAAAYLENEISDFSGYNTKSIGHSLFVDGNPYTAGCYWNNAGRQLWLNPYGVHGTCTGPQDCRTICVTQGMVIVRCIITLTHVMVSI